MAKVADRFDRLTRNFDNLLANYLFILFDLSLSFVMLYSLFFAPPFLPIFLLVRSIDEKLTIFLCYPNFYT